MELFGYSFPMISWLFTPGSLFILVNLMIGIIYLTTRSRNSPGQLARAHSHSSFSLLDRVRSINKDHGDYNSVGLTSQPSLLNRLRSLGSSQKPVPKTSEVNGEELLLQAKVVTKEKETTSRGEGVLEDCVDEKADDFINRFRQQLRLQRIDSMKRLGEMVKGK